MVPPFVRGQGLKRLVGRYDRQVQVIEDRGRGDGQMKGPGSAVAAARGTQRGEDEGLVGGDGLDLHSVMLSGTGT